MSRRKKEQKRRGRPKKVIQSPVDSVEVHGNQSEDVDPDETPIEASESEILHETDENLQVNENQPEPVEQGIGKICQDCKKEFQPSRFTPYQLFCTDCGKKHKREQIRQFRILRSKVSIPNYLKWKGLPDDHKESLRQEIGSGKKSALYKFFKKQDPDFIQAIKAGEV